VTLTQPAPTTAAVPTVPARGMLLRQTRHELVGLVRTPVLLFFALLFPLAFFVILSSLLGNETLDFRSGVRLAQFLAPAFASFGIAMATLSVMAIGFAEIRFNGVLKRLTGSPLPRWVLLGGRMSAGTLLAIGATVLLLAVGVVLYDVQILWERMPGFAVTVLVAAVSFCAIGLAIAALAPSFQAAIAIANGVVIPLAFLSDLFVIGELPEWLDAVGWAFPLKHLVNALGDGLNPFLDTSGFYLDHLAAIAAWGVAGAVVASWAIRRDAVRAERGTRVRHPAGAGGTSRAAARQAGRDAVPRRHGRPAAAALIVDQVRHANTLHWRDWSSPFFGIAFPVLLVLLFPTIIGGADPSIRLEVAQTIAATMTVYGTAVIAYVNMPQGLAEAREANVLKRWAGSPLPSWALFTGHAVSSTLLALLVMVASYALAVSVYGIVVPPSWPSAVVVLVVSALSFAALGMGVVSVVRGTQSALAVCLGSLITLSFVSDIFLFGVDFPPWLDALAWTFPLRHAVNAFGDAMAADASGVVLGLDHLAVIIAWGVAGLLVVLTRFNAEPVHFGRRASRGA